MISIGHQAFSQLEWAPIGAKWYFNRPSSTTNDFVVFESKKDSIINGKNVRVIDVKLNGSSPISKEYIYQNKDSIFYYNPSYRRFFLLYNFSAKIGDTITVHTSIFKPTKSFFSYRDSIGDFRYKVIAIDSILISSQWIKRQKVTLLKNGMWGFSKPDGKDYYILNKFGSLAYFFGIQSGFSPEEKLSICRCYSESGFDFKNPLWNYDCADITAIDNDIFVDNGIIYPNPFDNQLNIRTNEPIESVEIFDICGPELQVIYPNNELVVINTSLFKKGCYLFRVTTKCHIYCEKLIKN